MASRDRTVVLTILYAVLWSRPEPDLLAGAGAGEKLRLRLHNIVRMYDVPVLIIFFYLVMTGDVLAAIDAIGVPGILPSRASLLF